MQYKVIYVQMKCTYLTLQRHRPPFEGIQILVSYTDQWRNYFRKKKEKIEGIIIKNEYVNVFFSLPFLSYSKIILHAHLHFRFPTDEFIEYECFLAEHRSIDSWFHLIENMVKDWTQTYIYKKKSTTLKCTYSVLRFEMLHLQQAEYHYLPHKRRHRYEHDSHALYLLCDHVLKTLCINR